MRVEEVGARIWGGELVGVAGAGRDGFLRNARDAIGGVVESDAVPMNAGLRRQSVLDLHPEHVSGFGSDLASGQAVAIDPGGGGHPAKIHCRQPGAERGFNGGGAQPGRFRHRRGANRSRSGGGRAAGAEQSCAGEAESTCHQPTSGEHTGQGNSFSMGCPSMQGVDAYSGCSG